MTELNDVGLSDNALGAIAYITFIPAIVFLLLPPYNKNSYVRFHAWQSIFLTIAAFVVYFVFMIVSVVSIFFAPFLIGIFYQLFLLAWLTVWVLCAIRALNGKRFQLPIIGALAEQQANK